MSACLRVLVKMSFVSLMIPAGAMPFLADGLKVSSKLSVRLI